MTLVLLLVHVRMVYSSQTWIKLPPQCLHYLPTVFSVMSNHQTRLLYRKVTHQTVASWRPSLKAAVWWYQFVSLASMQASYHHSAKKLSFWLNLTPGWADQTLSATKPPHDPNVLKAPPTVAAPTRAISHSGTFLPSSIWISGSLHRTCHLLHQVSAIFHCICLKYLARRLCGPS